MVFGGLSEHGFICTKEKGLCCFGNNCSGQLGLGDLTIACGMKHSMFLVENPKNKNRELYSVGSDTNGELGLSGIGFKQRKLNTSRILVPTQVENIKIEVIDVFCGFFHTVILSNLLDSYSFGKNDCGQLGCADTKDSLKVVKVVISEKVLSVSCGYRFTIFSTIVGDVFFCGNDCDTIILGPNMIKSNVLIPRKILFTGVKEKIVETSCGGWSSIFLTVNQKVYISKEKDRILVDGDREFVSPKKSSPFHITNLKDEKIISIRSGGGHYLFISKNKRWFLGDNDYGQTNIGDERKTDNLCLFSIEGRKIIQSLLLFTSSIHFTKKDHQLMKYLVQEKINLVNYFVIES